MKDGRETEGSARRKRLRSSGGAAAGEETVERDAWETVGSTGSATSETRTAACLAGTEAGNLGGCLVNEAPSEGAF